MVLFSADRTCCVCRLRGKPVQIHHLDEDPTNHDIANLAVLCFDCHRDTQITGGFDRKLDGHQLRLYRDDWMGRVSARRDSDGPGTGGTIVGVMTGGEVTSSLERMISDMVQALTNFRDDFNYHAWHAEWQDDRHGA